MKQARAPAPGKRRRPVKDGQGGGTPVVPKVARYSTFARVVRGYKAPLGGTR